MRPSRNVACALLLASLLLCAVLLALRGGAMRRENPLATIVRDVSVFEARVEQRLDAGSYTYLALRDDDDGVRWAVTMGRGAPAGSRVRVRGMGRKVDFYSRRLSRRFADLTFGIVSRID